MTVRSEGTVPLYFCIRIPEYAAQAALRLRPAKAACAVAVLSGTPPWEQVCSVNTHARRMGVAVGMSRAELDSFVGLDVLRRSAEEEKSARNALLETAAAFTPRVQMWEESAAAFVMVMDMTGSSLIFGRAEEAAERVTQALARLNFFAQIAGSANFHAAICASHAVRSVPVILPPGYERAGVSALPLSTLALTSQQADTMTLWGLHTLADLAALPLTDLVVRLGQQGKRLHALARGEHTHLMVPEDAPLTLDEYIALDAPIDLLESLLFILGPMVDQLLQRAGNHALALANVTVRLGLDGVGADGAATDGAGAGGAAANVRVHERTVQPALPVMSRDLLLKLLHLDLQAHPPGAGVLSVAVHAEPGDRSKVQLGLFAPQLPESSRLDVALARIAALVGEGRVGRARLLDHHRPDSFAMERFIVRDCKPHVANIAHAVVMRRCRPPVPIRVQSGDERIVGFAVDGKRYTVQQAYGPWRRSGEWWASEMWSHEEWDVAALRSDTALHGDEDKLLCRITKNLLSQQWQMEATYD